MATHTIELTHGTDILIGDRRCYIGTAAGYAEEYAEDPKASVDRCIERGHETHWIGLHASVICADKGYYAAQTAKFASSPRLNAGDYVIVTDSVHGPLFFQIVHAPNQHYKLVRLVGLAVK